MDAHEHTKKRRQNAPRDSRWSQLLAWVSAHKKASIIACATVIVLLLSSIGFIILRQYPIETIDVPIVGEIKKKPKPTQFYSPLTGLTVADEAATKANITGVMIENSPDARPQSGLKDADVVYEAIAEGGITRFAALYQQSRPGLIGPVRSLRMYYLDWMTPYDASIAHVGGSLFSLQEVRNGAHRDIDQFFNAGTYWRTDDRYAPHNVYTDFAHLDELNSQKGFGASNPQAIARDDSKLEQGRPAPVMNVTMSGPSYDSTWRYDDTSQSYLRWQGGEPHMDREAGQIAAQVVVVLHSQMDLVMEDGWRENYHTSGAGDAIILAYGRAVDANWHKADAKSQLSFTTKDNKPLPLPRGKTWISAIPVNEGGGVSWQ